MEEFLRKRITQLRMQKGVSEYQMSYDLGHCRGYINNISSGKSLPSITEFFSICEYFDITPQAFFDEGHNDPALLSEAIGKLRSMSDDDILFVLTVINKISSTK
ncbi:MAG: helix-turn-helix transcriptional regulator [Lachnospiraceae bacterium]|nr:helix-turn-helix transcriptional regulator [Lachnospiraceae bacterium]